MKLVIVGKTFSSNDLPVLLIWRKYVEDITDGLLKGT